MKNFEMIGDDFGLRQMLERVENDPRLLDKCQEIVGLKDTSLDGMRFADEILDADGDEEFTNWEQALIYVYTSYAKKSLEEKVASLM